MNKQNKKRAKSGFSQTKRKANKGQTVASSTARAKAAGRRDGAVIARRANSFKSPILAVSYLHGVIDAITTLVNQTSRSLKTLIAKLSGARFSSFTFLLLLIGSVHAQGHRQVTFTGPGSLLESGIPITMDCPAVLNTSLPSPYLPCYSLDPEPSLGELEPIEVRVGGGIPSRPRSSGDATSTNPTIKTRTYFTDANVIMARLEAKIMANLFPTLGLAFLVVYFFRTKNSKAAYITIILLGALLFPTANASMADDISSVRIMMCEVFGANCIGGRPTFNQTQCVCPTSPPCSPVTTVGPQTGTVSTTEGPSSPIFTTVSEILSTATQAPTSVYNVSNVLPQTYPVPLTYCHTTPTLPSRSPDFTLSGGYFVCNSCFGEPCLNKTTQVFTMVDYGHPVDPSETSIPYFSHPIAEGYDACQNGIFGAVLPAWNRPPSINGFHVMVQGRAPEYRIGACGGRMDDRPIGFPPGSPICFFMEIPTNKVPYPPKFFNPNVTVDVWLTDEPVTPLDSMRCLKIQLRPPTESCPTYGSSANTFQTVTRLNPYTFSARRPRERSWFELLFPYFSAGADAQEIPPDAFGIGCHDAESHDVMVGVDSTTWTDVVLRMGDCVTIHSQGKTGFTVSLTAIDYSDALIWQKAYCYEPIVVYGNSSAKCPKKTSAACIGQGTKNTVCWQDQPFYDWSTGCFIIGRGTLCSCYLTDCAPEAHFFQAHIDPSKALYEITFDLHTGNGADTIRKISVPGRQITDQQVDFADFGFLYARVYQAASTAWTNTDWYVTKQSEHGFALPAGTWDMTPMPWSAVVGNITNVEPTGEWQQMERLVTKGASRVVYIEPNIHSSQLGTLQQQWGEYPAYKKGNNLSPVGVDDSIVLRIKTDQLRLYGTTFRPCVDISISIVGEEDPLVDERTNLFAVAMTVDSDVASPCKIITKVTTTSEVMSSTVGTMVSTDPIATARGDLLTVQYHLPPGKTYYFYAGMQTGDGWFVKLTVTSKGSNTMGYINGIWTTIKHTVGAANTADPEGNWGTWTTSMAKGIGNFFRKMVGKTLGSAHWVTTIAVGALLVYLGLMSPALGKKGKWAAVIGVLIIFATYTDAATTGESQQSCPADGCSDSFPICTYPMDFFRFSRITDVLDKTCSEDPAPDNVMLRRYFETLCWSQRGGSIYESFLGLHSTALWVEAVCHAIDLKQSLKDSAYQKMGVSVEAQYLQLCGGEQIGLLALWDAWQANGRVLTDHCRHAPFTVLGKSYESEVGVYPLITKLFAAAYRAIGDILTFFYNISYESLMWVSYTWKEWDAESYHLPSISTKEEVVMAIKNWLPAQRKSCLFIDSRPSAAASDYYYFNLAWCEKNPGLCHEASSMPSQNVTLAINVAYPFPVDAAYHVIRYEDLIKSQGGSMVLKYCTYLTTQRDQADHESRLRKKIVVLGTPKVNKYKTELCDNNQECVEAVAKSTHVKGIRAPTLWDNIYSGWNSLKNSAARAIGAGGYSTSV